MNSARGLLAWIFCSILLAAVALPASSANPNAFAWVPVYPQAKAINPRTIRNRDQLIYKCEFHLKESGARVRKFYEDKLKGAGFDVISKSGITGNSWDLLAEDARQKRTIDVNGTGQSDEVNVRVTASSAIEGR